MANRKIENAALLLNPLNEFDVKHDFQRFWTVMFRPMNLSLNHPVVKSPRHSQEEETPEKGKNIDQNGHSPSFYS